MHALQAFELILGSLVAMVVLQLVATRLHLPPAAALLVGGIAMAFAPGIPPVELDPELVLVVFLPPLLMEGAYFTVLRDLRRNLAGVLSLAIGAVVFTTAAVGLAVHAVLPSLPWAVCFALGAIVSPPDAVAAKAVLEHLALPRRLSVLLEGESLLNDATGLVLVRIAVAAAMTGAFSATQATTSFLGLAIGGVLAGIAIGYVTVRTVRALHDEYLVITVTLLSCWFSYLGAEAIGVSGVIATVTCGITLGWYQHEIFTATTRMQGTAFWRVVIFILEALVFILIGLSLRGVLTRLGDAGDAVGTTASVVGATVLAVIASRFVWVFGTEAIKRLVPVPGTVATDWRSNTVLAWAGMRGVVTLAVALALPDALPGRDLVLVASFAVILVTVLVQGTTLGLLIRMLGLATRSQREAEHLSEPQAWARIEAAQLAAIEPLAHDADGRVLHPRLLEQYRYRAEITRRHGDDEAFPRELVNAHYDVVLAGVEAGRAELLRLHRARAIHDDLLRVLERHLDLEELSARHNRA